MAIKQQQDAGASAPVVPYVDVGKVITGSRSVERLGVESGVRGIRLIPDLGITVRMTEVISSTRWTRFKKTFVVDSIELASGNIVAQHQFDAYDRALLVYRATIEKYDVVARVAA